MLRFVPAPVVPVRPESSRTTAPLPTGITDRFVRTMVKSIREAVRFTREVDRSVPGTRPRWTKSRIRSTVSRSRR